ncbi:MAG: ATP-binding protein, partial [Lachnospiraceae bacterium]|nr:ATP-binding protein [Lachnospiraceae bacterium]
MSESVFEMINSVSDIWKITMQAAMFLVLWAAVFGTKKGKRDGIAAAMFILVNMGLGFLSFGSWVRYAVLAFGVMGYGWMNYIRQIGKADIGMLGLYNLHSLSFLIANSIYMEVTNMMMKELDVLQESYMQQVYRCMSVGLTATIFFYTALFAAMTAILQRLIKGETVMEWQDVILLSVLNFVGSMIARIIGGLITVKIDDRVFLLFDEKPDLLWKMPLIAVLIFVGEAALIYFWQRYRILLADRQKHFVEEQQVKAMKKRLEEAENFYGSIRKVRHEMKNHMANIKGLADAGQYGEIEEYVQKMDETMQELEYKYMTGNAVTDVIINDKWRRAKKAGIRFDADFRYGGEIPVFDMGIILNNLLDNAIEACEKLEPGKAF